MTRVRCEGYREFVFVANDQKLTEIGFDLATQDLTTDDERQKDFIVLKEPKAKFYDYSLVTNLYGDAMASGSFDISSAMKKDPELKVALLELSDLVRAKREAGFKFDSKVLKRPVIGAFKIVSNADLFLSCHKEKGIAPLKSDAPPSSSGIETAR